MSDEARRMTDEPLSHLRRANPPWHHVELTECGRPVSDVARLTTPDEIRALVAKHGKQRAAFSTCMTCANSWSRRGVSTNPEAAWSNDPIAVIARMVRGLPYAPDDPTTLAVRTELLALGMLYEAHRDEFDALLAALSDAPSFEQAKAKRARR